MTLPNNLTQAQQEALIKCLKIAAARGREIREARERDNSSKHNAATPSELGRGRTIKTKRNAAQLGAERQEVKERRRRHSLRVHHTRTPRVCKTSGEHVGAS